MNFEHIMNFQTLKAQFELQFLITKESQYRWGPEGAGNLG